MKLIEMVNEHRYDLTDVELIILDYIINNKLDYEAMSIDTLAQVTHTSKSSIVRLSQKLGFSGFSEFKFFLKYNTENPKETPYNHNYLELLGKDIEDTLKYLKSTDFDDLSKSIIEAKNIYAYGTGYSENLYMNDLARNFQTSHKFITVFPSVTELFWNLDHLDEDDLIIICSYSGKNSELITAVNRLKSSNVKIVSLTPMRKNTLAELSDLSYYYVETSLNIESSTYIEFNFYVTLKIVIDTIYRSYLDYKNKIE